MEMVTSVESHYAEHLGPIDTWVIGDLDAATQADAVA
jgi:hypothetical protein